MKMFGCCNVKGKIYPCMQHEVLIDTHDYFKMFLIH